MKFDTPQELLVYVGKMLFERRLTDMAGGNISLRIDDTIYISPRYAGSRQHWHINPGTIVSGSIYTDEILNNPNFSREGKAHLGVYRSFPQARAIIHAHPFYVMPFCAAEKPIPPVLEATEKLDVIEPVPFAPSHSQALADNIVAGFVDIQERITKYAAAVLLPRHGLFTVSIDLLTCLDATERVNWNAWCILAQKMLPDF